MPDLHSWWLWAAGGSMLTVVAAGWRQLRSWLQFMRGLVIVHRSVEGNFASNLVTEYIERYFILSRFGDRVLDADAYFVRSHDRIRIVGMYLIRGRYLFWRGWRPLWIEFRSTNPQSPDQGQMSLEISCLRGSFDLEKLFLEACSQRDSLIDELENVRRYDVVHINGERRHGNLQRQGIAGQESKPLAERKNNHAGKIPMIHAREDLGERISPGNSAIHMLSLSPEALEVVGKVSRWHSSREWYRDRRIPWRIGCALYGAPGCGKTSLVRAIAQSLNMPVYVFGLTTLANDELERNWRAMRNAAPCIALIEEIDTAFRGREALGELTFECLLNCIDGVEEIDGLLLFVTTNDPDKLDPALGRIDSQGNSTRPGRLDYLLEMRPPDRAGLLKIASRILRDWPELWDEIVDAGDGESGAQFQQRCREVALARYWSQQDFQPSLGALP